MKRFLDALLVAMIVATFTFLIVGAFVFNMKQPSCYMMFSPVSTLWC